jgi:hypothetical protein
MVSNEQKLVDICFNVLLHATDPHSFEWFVKATNEQKAEWLREQLKSCGFPTTPCGSSWGVLYDNN